MLTGGEEVAKQGGMSYGAWISGPASATQR